MKIVYHDFEKGQEKFAGDTASRGDPDTKAARTFSTFP